MMLTEEVKPALDGAIPGWIVTVDPDGLPNATVLSQVFFVDEDHIALSDQFFSKTSENLARNPRLMIQALHPADLGTWILEAEYVRKETEGDLFDQMDMQLEATASMQGMQDIFKLKAAAVCKVTSVRKLTEAQDFAG